MKKTIAALIAGIVLGTTSVGVASSVYWARGGNTYSCEGIATGVICKDKYGSFGVSMTPNYVAITRRGKAVYGCKRGFGSKTSSCFGE